jgi:hypothetical protein
MTALRYQALVVEDNDHYRARIPDLGCEGSGASPDEALAAVREEAIIALRERAECDVSPPSPTTLMVVDVDLPEIEPL